MTRPRTRMLSAFSGGGTFDDLVTLPCGSPPTGDELLFPCSMITTSHHRLVSMNVPFRAALDANVLWNNVYPVAIQDSTAPRNIELDTLHSSRSHE